MEYRTLGKTGLRVSEVGYGAAQIGNINMPEDRVEEVLNAVLDVGINFIDTAAMYGQSEARIGKFISRRRDEFILATKCGDYVGETDGQYHIVRDYSREGILRTIDQSRKKLDMDVMSIEQLTEYIQEREDEIARARTAIDGKQSARSAADAVFKS